MFWIFRKRKPMKPAHFYLDCAAGVLQARGKCEGSSYDAWGRVDATGAMRIAVWGAPSWDEVPPRTHRKYGPLLWMKYDETKMLLYRYLAEHHPSGVSWGSADKSWMNTRLHKWSDSTPPHEVVRWMREAAFEEKHNPSVPV